MIISVLFLLSSQAYAYPNCTDIEVVKRVCESVPSDDTGIGRRLGEFGGISVALTDAAEEVTPEAYVRFARVFQTAVTAYRKLSERVSPRDRAWFDFRLGKIKTPTPRQLALSPLSSILWGADASYKPFSDRVQVSPLILNSPGLSDAELLAIVAHEIGHYLDPSAAKDFFKRDKTRLNYLSAKVHECFLTSYRDGTGFRTNKTVEDYADWMASNVVSDYVNQASTYEIKLNRLRSTAYAFCPKARDWEATVEKLLGDQHSSSVERVVTFMNSPDKLDTVACGPVIVEATTRNDLGSCAL